MLKLWKGNSHDEIPYHEKLKYLANQLILKANLHHAMFSLLVDTSECTDWIYAKRYFLWNLNLLTNGRVTSMFSLCDEIHLHLCTQHKELLKRNERHLSRCIAFNWGAFCTSWWIFLTDYTVTDCIVSFVKQYKKWHK